MSVFRCCILLEVPSGFFNLLEKGENMVISFSNILNSYKFFLEEPLDLLHETFIKENGFYEKFTKKLLGKATLSTLQISSWIYKNY